MEAHAANWTTDSHPALLKRERTYIFEKERKKKDWNEVQEESYFPRQTMGKVVVEAEPKTTTIIRVLDIKVSSTRVTSAVQNLHFISKWSSVYDVTKIVTFLWTFEFHFAMPNLRKNFRRLFRPLALRLSWLVIRCPKVI